MDSPRSYILETPGGSQYRRNRSHIHKSNESAQAEKMDSNVTNTIEQNCGENHSVKQRIKLIFHCVNTSYLTDDSYCPAPAGPAKRQKKMS